MYYLHVWSTFLISQTHYGVLNVRSLDHKSKACQNEMYQLWQETLSVLARVLEEENEGNSATSQGWRLNRTFLSEARKIVDTSKPSATGKTYGAVVKVSTTNLAVQTEETWGGGGWE